jgi:hypothetical protein
MLRSPKRSLDFPSNGGGDWRRNRISYQPGAVFTIPREHEVIREPLQSRPLAKRDRAIFNGVAEPAPGEAVEPGGDRACWRVPSKSPIRVEVTMSVPVTCQRQVRRKISPIAALWNMPNPFKIDLA